jgi:hypothetical protein
MKARDFAAELISDIAEEYGYVVYKYECIGPGHASLVYELNDDDDDDSIDKYKLLFYSDHSVTLLSLSGNKVIDLHNPDSVDEIDAWFNDLEEAFDNPNGSDPYFGGFPINNPVWNSSNPAWIVPSTTITTTPPMHHSSGPGWSSGSFTSTNSTFTTNTLKVTQNIFNFNPSFGSLSFGSLSFDNT